MKKIYKIVYICILFFVFTTHLKAQCTFTTAVPYFETFAGITNNNQLPTCWAASNTSVTCLTYTSSLTSNRLPRTGPSLAAFSNTLGAHYFYTNGIYLNAGITYSTSIWFTTEYYGYTNWTDLSILYGVSQSSTALTNIISTNGPALSPVYRSLGGTFSVSTSGIYYVAIRATSNGIAGANYLSWDDFLIEAPCFFNASFLNISSTNSVLCQGQSATLIATGGVTYTWSTGANTSSIVIGPNSNFSYYVSSTNSVGCVATKSISFLVNPSPVVSIFSNKISVCKSDSATLYAYGAVTYSWNTGTTGNNIKVSPSINNSYTVTGTNAFGCSANAVQSISVLPLPNVNIAASSIYICSGETTTLFAGGASQFTWSAGNLNVAGNLFITSPSVTTVYSVVGTDNLGCSLTKTISILVSPCTSISEKEFASDFVFYPNPLINTLNIQGLIPITSIEIYNCEGKLINFSNVEDTKTTIDLSSFTNGIYFLKIKSINETFVKKIVKE